MIVSKKIGFQTVPWPVLRFGDNPIEPRNAQLWRCVLGWPSMIVIMDSESKDGMHQMNVTVSRTGGLAVLYCLKNKKR